MNTLAPEETDSADPDERGPAGPLYVPVRLGSAGGHQLCFMRTPLGVRTAVGFTTRGRLASVLGARQRWIRLAEPMLRTLAEPLGVTAVTVDPRFAAAPPVSGGARGGRTGGTAGPLCARRAPLDGDGDGAYTDTHTDGLRVRA
ncbi:SAV_915 family protein [Streptomyces sp. CAU 1734]|uniref:SAV_915 family protein n=1 Tax=Streptomyces sp. CAU 1734 TaxID=3140360 RepID=UPI0032606ADE